MRACCDGGVPGLLAATGSGEVWIVGIQPGREELKSGRPFTGPNGELLSATLASIGFDMDGFTLGNILCGPNCSANKGLVRFAQEVREYKPKLVVTLGAPACELLLDNKLGLLRGQMVRRGDIWYMPTVQPIAALQGAGASVGNDLIRDFRKIPHILRFEEKPYRYHVCESSEEAQEALDNLPRDRDVCIDIETDEVSSKGEDQQNAWDHKLTCFGVGTSDSAVVIPAEYSEGLTWPTDVKWGGHNAWSFDRAGIQRYLSQTIDIHWDTLLESYALDERRASSINTPLHRLKPLCREYIGAGFWEQGKKEDEYKYNALDVINTCRLKERFDPMLAADGVGNVYSDIMIPASHMLSDAQIYGCKVDVNEMARILIDWMPKLQANLDRLRAMAIEYGWPADAKPINPNSPKQLSVLLYDIIGLPQGYNTGRSTAKAILDELDHPFIDELKTHRTLDKMLSVYIFGVRDDLKHDGRLHPKPLQHGTVTGRPAYTDPPVQTIPQEHTVGSLAELRRMFVPTSDEYVIVEADYAQLDIWMAACLSGDPNMLHDLQDPYWPNGAPDFHSRVTEYVLGANPLHASLSIGSPERAYWENRRFAAKKVTFGPMFMEGPNGLADKHTGIGCSVQEARKHLNNWYRRYATFREWQLSIVREARTNGELVSIFGRKRRFPLILDARSDRQAGNFPIQSAESDCTLTSAIELHPHLLKLDSHILWLVHDSIVMEVAKAHFDTVIQLVHFIMTKPRAHGLLGVPVEIKSGPNWYDTHKVEIPTHTHKELQIA